jgi:hypothetical protein
VANAFLALLPWTTARPAAAAAEPSSAPRAHKVCGVYTNVLEFASADARAAAIAARPSFLMDKHKRALAAVDDAAHLKLIRDCGFDTLFMTIYPLWAQEWWTNPAAGGLITSALEQAKTAGVRVHLGLSLFNAQFCADPSRYPGASRTIQCDGTRPSWVCFFDDRLWDAYTRDCIELARLGRSVPGVLDGIFLDPEAYGPECYLCFCDNCVRKFDAWSGAAMPTGLVKPDAWLRARPGMWKKYTVDWHNQEVRRHATALREAVHAVDPSLQLSSLLWDYPVAVGVGDPRQQYFRMLAIGLGTSDKPSWTLPEHTYYSDAADVGRIVGQIESDLAAAGAADRVRVLPGLRLLRRPASSLADRGRVIGDSAAVGYWLYELADLTGQKTPIDFEGNLVDPPAAYVSALSDMNRQIRGGSEKSASSSLPPGSRGATAKMGNAITYGRAGGR